VRRIPEKSVTDRAVLHAVLDAGLVAHVGVVDDTGQPYVVPVAYARDGDRLLIHGSTGSRLFRTLADGSPTCVTVTLLDGLVLARSAFESSMRYRGAMALGVCTVLEGQEKYDALRTISDHLLPDRWDDIRPPSRKELAATLVLALPLDEASVKVSDGMPDDLEEDLDRPVWAGVVPLRESFGEPVPDTAGAAFPVPAYVTSWTR
jgi:hypothetical protein